MQRAATIAVNFVWKNNENGRPGTLHCTALLFQHYRDEAGRLSLESAANLKRLKFIVMHQVVDMASHHPAVGKPIGTNVVAVELLPRLPGWRAFELQS